METREEHRIASEPPRARRTRRWLTVGAMAVVVVALAVAVVVLVTRDDGGRDVGVGTTTTVPTASAAVWPTGSNPTRYGDPVDAARGFATDFVGFVNPVVGGFRQGDGRSGEVPVQPRTDGPVTTVLVRQLGSDDSWSVIGASTPNIQVTAPAVLARIASPVAVAGTSTAFEATVDVEVREDANPTPLGKGFVMGGANGQMGPFSGSIPFTRPAAGAGAVVFTTSSAETGAVSEATVLRVEFLPAS